MAVRGEYLTRRLVLYLESVAELRRVPPGAHEVAVELDVWG